MKKYCPAFHQWKLLLVLIIALFITVSCSGGSGSDDPADSKNSTEIQSNSTSDAKYAIEVSALSDNAPHAIEDIAEAFEAPLASIGIEDANNDASSPPITLRMLM